MAKGRRRANKRRRQNGKVTLKASAALVRGGANAGNIGYVSEMANAGVLRVRVRRKS